MAYYIIKPNKKLKMAKVRGLTVDDIFYISQNLSDINLEELAAMTNISPLIALSVTAKSGESYCVTDDNDTVCGAFGIIPEKNIPNTAAIWMVTTKDIKNIAIPFIRGSKSWISGFNERFSVIYCRVYEKNSFTRRWLELMGFEHSSDLSGAGVRGEQFLEYFRIKQ